MVIDLRTRLSAALLLAGLAAAGAQAGEVFVLGNTETGHVVIRGNTANAAVQVHDEAKSIRDTGWVQLFGDDARGWGAVSCVAEGGRYHFFLATGHQTEAGAAMLAKAAADRFLASKVGRLVFMCAPRWNNRGQPLAFGGDGKGSPADPPDSKPTISDIVIGVPQGLIRNQVRKDYKRDCLPPAESAKADIRPFAPGTAPAKDVRAPAVRWKPADWCPPPPSKTTTGTRG